MTPCWPVVAVGNEYRVARRDFGEYVDLSIRAGTVDALIGPGSRFAVLGTTTNFEVVDLFELRLSWSDLVMFVGDTKPSCPRYEDFDRDETVRLESFG